MMEFILETFFNFQTREDTVSKVRSQTKNPNPNSISVLGSGNNGKASISKGHMVGVGKMDDAEYDMLG